MRNVIAVMLMMAGGTCFGQSGMQVTWPNGASLTAAANAVDDAPLASAIIKTKGVYKYDLIGKNPPAQVLIPGIVPEPFPVVAKASLRVKFYSDGSASVRWYGNGLGGEAGTAVADGSGVFTVKMVDLKNVNRFYNVTVTPIP